MTLTKPPKMMRQLGQQIKHRKCRHPVCKLEIFGQILSTSIQHHISVIVQKSKNKEEEKEHVAFFLIF